MASDKVKTLTDGTFDDEIKQGVVLVDLWAEWCGPCRRLAPAVDALASEYDGRATVAKLNIDENPNTPAKYRVMGIPTCSSSRMASLPTRWWGCGRRKKSPRLSISSCNTLGARGSACPAGASAKAEIRDPGPGIPDALNHRRE
jgi:thioredoxin 1